MFGWVNYSNNEYAINYGCRKTKYIPEEWDSCLTLAYSPDLFKKYLAEFQSMATGLALTSKIITQYKLCKKGTRPALGFQFRHGNKHSHHYKWHKWENPYKSHGESSVTCVQTGWLCTSTSLIWMVWRWMSDFHKQGLPGSCRCPCKCADLLYKTRIMDTFKLAKGEFWKDTFWDDYMNVLEENS